MNKSFQQAKVMVMHRGACNQPQVVALSHPRSLWNKKQLIEDLRRSQALAVSACKAIWEGQPALQTLAAGGFQA
jgi:hypothetical protein